MSDAVRPAFGGFVEIQTRNGWRGLLRVDDISQVVPRNERVKSPPRTTPLRPLRTGPTKTDKPFFGLRENVATGVDSLDFEGGA